MFNIKFKKISEICPDPNLENNQFSKADSYKIAKPNRLKTSFGKSLLSEFNLVLKYSPRIESTQFQRSDSIASSMGSFPVNENLEVPIAQVSFSGKSQWASENNSFSQNK